MITWNCNSNSLFLIWGTDHPRTNITVKRSWGKNAKTLTDDKGNWKLKLEKVWFCSGQSNMEPVKGNNNQPVIGSNETILTAARNPFYSPRLAAMVLVGLNKSGASPGKLSFPFSLHPENIKMLPRHDGNKDLCNSIHDRCFIVASGGRHYLTV